MSLICLLHMKKYTILQQQFPSRMQLYLFACLMLKTVWWISFQTPLGWEKLQPHKRSTWRKPETSEGRRSRSSRTCYLTWHIGARLPATISRRRRLEVVPVVHRETLWRVNHIIEPMGFYRSLVFWLLQTLGSKLGQQPSYKSAS